MTTAALAPALRRLHRPLLATSAVMITLAVFSLCAMLFDDRTLLHESVWLKPLKFAVAFTLYTGTLAWLLSFPHRGQRLTWWMGTVFAIAGVADVGFIAVQAARGTFSHFNSQTDAVNSIGQIVFDAGIPALFFANLIIALTLTWQRVTDRPTGRAINAGLGIAAAAMALMIFAGGGAPQQTTDAYGNPVSLRASHTVTTGQVHDDGGGMPITHWSTVGGDLRIPHFVGLHAIQVLILAALLLNRFGPRVPWLRGERARADLIRVLALGYAGLVGVLAWQAHRGQPLTHPDSATLTGFGLVAVVTAAGIGLVYAVRRRASSESVLDTPATQPIVSATAPRPASTSPISQ
ncbi:MAG: hypothetical protein JWN03_4169 [Nocardia sp.]|uniref:hypothetical protein n=1 Tax=Nocardia sp. TaxID=1821 RepID=UPI00261C06E6|nr:hypothetical protein [Nocardia sp.]MCU1643894.1 hypothetical protein [Nocardia sp.]